MVYLCLCYIVFNYEGGVCDCVCLCDYGGEIYCWVGNVVCICFVEGLDFVGGGCECQFWYGVWDCQLMDLM